MSDPIAKFELSTKGSAMRKSKPTMFKVRYILEGKVVISMIDARDLTKFESNNTVISVERFIF